LNYFVIPKLLLLTMNEKNVIKSIIKTMGIAFALFFCQGLFAQGRVIYVNIAATDSINANGSYSLPYKKIQIAINIATDGDTILVENGTYVENVTLNKKIYLLSRYIYSSDSSDILRTRIDGGLNGSYGLVLSGGADLNGLTIFNSYPGGILVNGEARVNNSIAENNQGTGISVFPPQGTKSEFYNIITRNNKGNGFHEHLAVVLIDRIKSYGNDDYGIALQSGIDTVKNALIYKNKTSGVLSWSSNSLITNSTIIQNDAHGFWCHAGGIIRLKNSIIWSNTSGSGRISDARLFVLN
jgi:hypothetical protein